MNNSSHQSIDLKGLTPREIDRFCTDRLGQRPGQGTRAAVWLYRRKVEDIDAMADLNRPFRDQLKRHVSISSLTIVQRITSEDGTEKLLYRLDDGNTIEGVLIPGPGDGSRSASRRRSAARRAAASASPDRAGWFGTSLSRRS